MAYRDPEKVRAYNVAYRATHPEKVKASQTAYYAEHREEAKAYRAAYRVTHLEEVKACQAAYQAAYPEKSRQSSANWKATHPEARAAYQVTYRAAHPEIHLLNNARRRAQIKGLPATLTTEQWQAILAAYKHRCAYCGKVPKKGKRLTKDRVIAGARGGGYTRENIVPACGPCNSGKRDNFPKKPVRLVLV